MKVTQDSNTSTKIETTVAIKVYKYLLELPLEKFEERNWIKKKKNKKNVFRYSMDGAWTAQAKYDFRKDMKDKRDSHDKVALII